MSKLSALVRSAAALFCLTGFFYSVAASAQEKNCECHFSDQSWEAFGTRAACTAWTKSGGKSCNIAFGGQADSDALVEGVVGKPLPNYALDTAEVLQTYISAYYKNDVKTLTDPSFLNRALPLFMRAALLHGPAQSEDLDLAKALNKLIEAFVAKNEDAIGKVFRREIDPFDQTIEDATFSVGHGWVSVEYKDSTMITTYMP